MKGSGVLIGSTLLLMSKKKKKKFEQKQQENVEVLEEVIVEEKQETPKKEIRLPFNVVVKNKIIPAGTVLEQGKDKDLDKVIEKLNL